MNLLKTLSLLLLLSACAAKTPEPKTETTTVQIKTKRSTNGGTPFYAVVKSIDYANFLVDDYEKVATETMTGKEIQLFSIRR